MAKRNAKSTKFEHRLVLMNWLLNLFEAANLEELARPLKDVQYEGFTEENLTNYYHILNLRLFPRETLTDEILLGYDENIVRHWKSITAKRSFDGQKLYPKYFQYLSLLFSEIYLDRFFRDSETLLKGLNAYAQEFNNGETLQQKTYGLLFAEGLTGTDKISPFEQSDLRKLAFWSATGSGKTLLMHIHVLQYQHYLKLHGQENQLNRIILLTPNEGLSLQHKDEFKLSGMDAELFSKDTGSLFTGEQIEIIDIHKLKETSGSKTVAIDAFEGNNLVLVDEGHRGTTGKDVGIWMQRRNRLCEHGFSFEYSATFGQAMKASGNKDLAQEYAKCILFDYSYKYFYNDGYGKEYRILNLEDDRNEDHRRHYLTACLLAFYQQQRIFQDKQNELFSFLLEKPLWIFVGGSVTKSPRKQDVSDVVSVLLFLARFVKNKDQSIRSLDKLLSGHAGLLDAQGRELFSGAFTYLSSLGLTGETAFNDILKLLFNANVVGALHVRQIKGGRGAEGEVALHLGEDNDPFGVINVGDASGLCKLCEKHPEELAVTESEFSGSLFHDINTKDSKINVLIGSKKFSEGWNSWRVSTMGLLNIGKKEGSQIIQLFGRGVRLKGKDFCLKRSSRILGLRAPKNIERLETLNVFGVKADYMRQFKEYLEEEGLPSNENRIECVLPVVKNLGNKQLKTIQLKDGVDFKKQGPRPTLELPDKYLSRLHVVVDWYPKIQAISSRKSRGESDIATQDEMNFSEQHIAFLDIDQLYFDLQQFKNEKAWYNLNIHRENIGALLSNHEWYKIRIPKEEMALRTFDQVRLWQEIASGLLKKYCDRLYKTRKAEFEQDHLEYKLLTDDDSNFIDEYLFLIDQSRQDIKTKLEELNELIKNGGLKDTEFSGIKSIFFDNHLYQPLIHINSELVEVKPVHLNEGERDFVEDLRLFCTHSPDFFEGKELYLLRNMSRGHGIGFFEAGNFYPDFIIWLLVGDKQYINFIDPKGIRNLKGEDDPKINFYKDIKTLESDLHDDAVVLNSFIVSNTHYKEIKWWGGGMTKAEFESRNVFFQLDDKANYIQKMMKKIMR